MKLSQLRDPDSHPFALSKNSRLYFVLPRSGKMILLALVLTVAATAATLTLQWRAEREMPVPDGWVHGWWLLCLATCAAWLYGAGVVVDRGQRRVIWWRGLRFGLFNFEFKLQTWPVDQIQRVQLFSFMPVGRNAVMQYAVELQIRGGPQWRLSTRSHYLRQRGEAERVAKAVRAEMSDDTYMCSKGSIVRKCEELDEPFHARMMRMGTVPAKSAPVNARFEISDADGVLQVLIRPKPQPAGECVGFLIVFPIVMAGILFFLGLVGFLAGLLYQQAYLKHWGFVMPALLLSWVFVILLTPFRAVLHDALSFLWPPTGRLRISRECLTWSRRAWLGEKTMAAGEIEELYVTSKGDLVALSDRKQLLMEMEVTEPEGERLRDLIAARFGSAEGAHIAQSAIDIPAR